MKKIQDVVDAGKLDEAQVALEQLLELGPNNLEGLKLLAKLHETSGRFNEEAKIWDKIARVDREDPDAAGYYLRRQIEDREHFYFTDDIADEGRRFLAYPRGLINAAAAGLCGCVVFLMLARLGQYAPLLATPPYMLGMFALTVMLPWSFIIFIYIRSLRWVMVSKDRLIIATRLSRVDIPWLAIERLCLVRSAGRHGPCLSLILLPKAKDAPAIELDLDQSSTAIRARTYLIRELSKTYGEPEFTGRDSLGLQGRRLKKY